MYTIPANDRKQRMYYAVVSVDLTELDRTLINRSFIAEVYDFLSPILNSFHQAFNMSSTGGSPQVPIAIVGLACRFPGDATSPSKLWDLLKEGRGRSFICLESLQFGCPMGHPVSCLLRVLANLSQMLIHPEPTAGTQMHSTILTALAQELSPPKVVIF